MFDTELTALPSVQAGVCLKMAECHAALKETRAAIDLYYRGKLLSFS